MQAAGKATTNPGKAATVAVLALGLLAGAIFSGCARRALTAEPPSLPTVVVVTPQRREAVREITLPGDLVGYYEAALHAKVTGYLSSIKVDKGDTVKKGQVLAELEVPELADNLRRAHANLEIERLTYDRLRKVRESDPRLIAQQEVDVAQSKWAQAKAEVGLFDTMLAYSKIVAPFDGIITGRFADPGALIRAGGGDIGVNQLGADVSSAATEGSGGHDGSGPVVTMASIDRLRIYVYVPESEVGAVRTGMRADIVARAFPGQPFMGTVTRYAGALDLSTRTMLTEVDIENPTHRLYPRMYVDVRLDLVRHPNALELPTSAVALATGEQAFVYVVHEGELVKVPVGVGINDGSWIEITKGLNGSEQVAEYMGPSLLAGTHVRPVEDKNNAPAPQLAHQ